MDLEKRSGIKLTINRKQVHPIQLDFASESGRNIFLETVKRVIATHADVLEALAKR